MQLNKTSNNVTLRKCGLYGVLQGGGRVKCDEKKKDEEEEKRKRNKRRKRKRKRRGRSGGRCNGRGGNAKEKES